ncbi:hypothetical protein KKC1_27120 [Calderihabitans maritimus]|uniref:Uncharacterized protein n=1 Tax=Calderihabitans maritimus TaxID=1246530 RepID=A0A1Z5HVL1_9FIRM|nr:hypothetical protein KKC1_27120 [Calderihabitans maritimus]
MFFLYIFIIFIYKILSNMNLNKKIKKSYYREVMLFPDLENKKNVPVRTGTLCRTYFLWQSWQTPR